MIRDRGKIKWQGAFFMPEHVKMLSDVRRDDLKVTRPQLDEYQIEEFDQKLLLAMEFAYKVKVNVWDDGFIKEYRGLVQRLDGLNKVIYLNTDDNNSLKIKFVDAVGIEIMDK